MLCFYQLFPGCQPKLIVKSFIIIRTFKVPIFAQLSCTATHLLMVVVHKELMTFGPLPKNKRYQYGKAVDNASVHKHPMR